MARGVSLGSLAKDERPRETIASARRLLRYLVPYRRDLVVALTWLVGTSIATAVTPAVTGRIVDTALAIRSGDRSLSAVTYLVGALLALELFHWVSQREQILRLGTIGQRALFDVRGAVFARVLDLPIAYFESVESGDLMSRLINDIETVNRFLSQGFRRVLGALIGLVATLTGMLLVDVRLAVATLVVVPVLLVATRGFGTIARRAFRRRQQTLGDVSSTLAEELSGIRVAQAFARTGRESTAFADRNAANRDASVTAAAVSSAFSPTLAVISAMAIAVVVAYGGRLAASGVVTIGVVVAFVQYARSFFSAVSQLSSLYAETQSALAGGERIFALLDTPAEVTDRPDAVDLGRSAGAVTFESVSFRYASGPVVLSDVALAVEAGTTVAVVGRTGAGKTSLVNLVARFYDPTAGRVLIDGRDVREVTLSSLRRQIGMVLQEPFLFDGTIADNIRYGRLDATDTELRAAAAAARATDFVERLPEGFDTPVGERGALLSTGQRQLIAFARAILTDPAILILDEATASVDTLTERLIQDALATLLAGRTALVIAHRLSTVRKADQIVVLDGGRIVERGSYATLLARDGLFAELHRAQFPG